MTIRLQFIWWCLFFNFKLEHLYTNFISLLLNLFSRVVYLIFLTNFVLMSRLDCSIQVVYAWKNHTRSLKFSTNSISYNICETWDLVITCSSSFVMLFVIVSLSLLATIFFPPSILQGEVLLLYSLFLYSILLAGWIVFSGKHDLSKEVSKEV